MAQQPIRFNDGAAYERGMGGWSRIAGEIFLDWLAPSPALRWLDVGCGGGAFTELLAQTCTPAEMRGVDPSEAQLVFARSRPATRSAEFLLGDAMALPFEANRFDAAVMALVIFFVPEPAKGVAEMTRVVGPGGLVAAYAWDMAGGGFPFHPVRTELAAAGIASPVAPSQDASRLEVLQSLWTDAGLEAIETREILVRRSFSDFEEYWRTSTAMGATVQALAAMPPDQAEQIRQRVRGHLESEASGRVTFEARANAIKGRVPT